MSRKNHAAADADAHEGGETILVDTSAKDGSQVTRRAGRGSVTDKPRNADNERMDDWEQKSRKVQKRLVQQARSFNQQIADIQAENQRQLALRDDRIARLERGGETTNTDDAAHAKVMDGFEEAIAAAQEEGDSRKVAKLTREMTQADNKFWAAKTAKQVGGDGGKGNGADKGGGAGAGGGVTQPNVLTPTKAGVEWARANAEWFEDPTDDDHVAARALANALYKKKAADGDDRDEPEFYEEIRRQVAKRFPEIETTSTIKGGRRDDPDDEDEDDDDDVRNEDRRDSRRERDDREDRRRDEPRAARNASSLSLPNRGAPDKHRPNRLSTITSAEQRAMRAVNLDPSNDKHVLSWLNSRNEMEAQS